MLLANCVQVEEKSGKESQTVIGPAKGKRISNCKNQVYKLVKESIKGNNKIEKSITNWH